MARGRLSALAVLGLGVLCGWTRAQSPEPAYPRPRPREVRYVSLQKQRSGSPVLLIEYPWKIHANASIEVRLVTEDDGKSPEPAPMLFLKTRFKGKLSEWVYQCLDRSDERDTSRTFTSEDKIDFEILGRRNALEKASVCVVRRFKGDQKPPGVAAVLLSLDSWAIHEKLLYVDLPPEAFGQPGKLYLWFLRDEKVLWSQTVRWPGYGP